MAHELKIKNIGKLTDAKIRIGQFTVFAGPNNTGKSFVSKTLYSLFDAMNANHAEVHIKNLTRPIVSHLSRLLRRVDSEDSLVDSLVDQIKKLETLVKNSSLGDIEELDEAIPGLVDIAKNMVTEYRAGRPFLESMLEQEGSFPKRFIKDILNDIAQCLTTLEKSLRDKKAMAFIVYGIQYKIRQNLLQNFQVPNLSNLRGKEDARSEIDMGAFGKFGFSNGEVYFEINSVWLNQLQQYSNVIYLESPVYWKLKNALENLRIDSRYRRIQRERLSGVPGYFYDLASALKYQYTGDMAFPDLYDKLTGKEIIGGKIAISESGDLSFQENGRSFSLPVTAMGVANLGVLALLIERKVLDKNSVLFIDEPEAHLHPAWQVYMAEILFELAKGGVNVVIATHSADILKWLEVHIKKNPDDEGLVALNKFPSNGVEADDQDFSDKIAAIKQELTRPFADLYTAGL